MNKRHEDMLQRKAKFSGVKQVVADPLRFKLRLGIGQDAYAALRLKKHLQELWDTGGMAATGAALAAAPSTCCGWARGKTRCRNWV